MSQTDLEFRQDHLPKIRVPPPPLSPAIKPIQTPEPSEGSKSATSAPTPAPAATRIRTIIIQRRPEGKDKEDKEENDKKDEYEEEHCRTPTAKEHRIPEVLTCPAAPRKPARAPACKRKLALEMEFFDVANRGEVEEFFRSSFVVVNKPAKRINNSNSCQCK